MATYREGDATRIIPLVSDDGGLTWYPRGGNAAEAIPLDDHRPIKKIRLESADAGTTWTPALP